MCCVISHEGYTCCGERYVLCDLTRGYSKLVVRDLDLRYVTCCGERPCCVISRVCE